jgi:small GTP-binding protein
MLHSVYIIKNGALLVEYNFGADKSLNGDMCLVSGFISAIQSFSKELTGSVIKTINFESYTFHFYKDLDEYGLIYVLVSDKEYNIKEINCKIRKIASKFTRSHANNIDKYKGRLDYFDSFHHILKKINIDQENCGYEKNCQDCEFNVNKCDIIYKFEGSQSQSNSLNEVIDFLLNNITELRSVIVLNNEGNIAAESSIKQFKSQDLNLVLDRIKPLISKVICDNISFSNGSISTNNHRIFYLELVGKNSGLLILITDLFFEFEDYFPLIYFYGETISSILNENYIKNSFPRFLTHSNLKIDSLTSSIDKDQTFNKILLIGDEKTGKSSLIYSYINERFNIDYKPTLGISILEKKLYITKRIQFPFQIYDMGGFDYFKRVRSFFYRKISFDFVILIFDYTSPESLDHIEDWREEFSHYSQHKPISYLLLGNKIDLINGSSELRTRANLIAEKMKIPLFEVSSLTGKGIDEMFMYIISSMTLKY